MHRHTHDSSAKESKSLENALNHIRLPFTFNVCVDANEICFHNNKCYANGICSESWKNWKNVRLLSSIIGYCFSSHCKELIKIKSSIQMIKMRHKWINEHDGIWAVGWLWRCHSVGVLSIMIIMMDRIHISVSSPRSSHTHIAHSRAQPFNLLCTASIKTEHSSHAMHIKWVITKIQTNKPTWTCITAKWNEIEIEILWKSQVEPTKNANEIS